MRLAKSQSAFFVLLTVTLSIAPHSCEPKSQPSPASAPKNVVAAFLSHADRQYETEEQQKEIIRALQDMLNRSPDDLRRQRYADYQGKENSWSLTTLVKSYFVPTQTVSAWTDDDFYRDVSKPDAQTAIREQLTAIQKEAPAH